MLSYEPDMTLGQFLIKVHIDWIKSFMKTKWKS